MLCVPCLTACLKPVVYWSMTVYLGTLTNSLCASSLLIPWQNAGYFFFLVKVLRVDNRHLFWVDQRLFVANMIEIKVLVVRGHACVNIASLRLEEELKEAWHHRHQDIADLIRMRWLVASFWVPCPFRLRETHPCLPGLFSIYWNLLRFYACAAAIRVHEERIFPCSSKIWAGLPLSYPVWFL